MTDQMNKPQDIWLDPRPSLNIYKIYLMRETEKTKEQGDHTTGSKTRLLPSVMTLVCISRVGAETD